MYECKIPTFNNIQITKKSLADCPLTNNYTTRDDIPDNYEYGITFKNIAQGWKDAGMNMDYCKNALRVVGGECDNPGSVYRSDMCTIRDKSKGFQAWNPYQLDSAMRPYSGWGGSMFYNDPPPDIMDLNNPCHAAIIAHDLFITTTTTWEGTSIYGTNPECKGAPLNTPVHNYICGAIVSNHNQKCTAHTEKQDCEDDIDCRNISLQVDYGQSETCNWDGPLCHTDNKGGRIWNGGGNPSYQGSPWPCYGYISFLQRIPGYSFPSGISTKCSGNTKTCTYLECSILESESSRESQQICDQIS